MLKKIVPLALVGLMGGCAAYQEAQSLQNGLQTFIVRSVTMKVGTDDKCQVALAWAGTSALRGIKRGSTTVNVTPSSSFGQDEVPADGTTYTYTATFENNKDIVRQIQPFTVEEAGEVIAPEPFGVPFATPPRSGLKFKWKMKNDVKPSGFMLTVTDSAAPTVPVYNAFLDAASHSVAAETGTYEVAFGTPSDMGALTKDVMELMAGMDPRFAKKDSGVSADQLDASKTYLWIASPLKIDEKTIRFAIGTSAGSGFKVTP